MKGAFTGAVSASMLKSLGVQWALAGHSERRVIFGEKDEYINGQCLKLIEMGMSVMLCIGESESEYEQNLAGAVCAVQLKKGLAGISKADLGRVAIACTYPSSPCPPPKCFLVSMVSLRFTHNIHSFTMSSH
jgi:triosephosphate isomerase (TIM)